MDNLKSSKELEGVIPKFPDCVKIEYQHFQNIREKYLIAKFIVREEITFTVEIGHGYSLVRYGDLQLFPDRIDVVESYSKGYKTKIAFYAGDKIVATIPLEKRESEE